MSRPSTWAYLKAWARQGAHEVSQMLPAFPTSNVKPVEEPGIMGNPVPQQVWEEQRDAPPSYAEYRERQAHQRCAEASAARSQEVAKDKGREPGE